MKIRLEDTPEQVEAFAAVLRDTFDVRNETSNYRNRPPSPLVRRYLTVGMRTVTVISDPVKVRPAEFRMEP